MKFEKLPSCCKIFLATSLLVLFAKSSLRAQFDYSCLFDAAGCDYTEASGSQTYPTIKINGANAVVTLPYCTTEEEVIAAFTGWLENLIDPGTDCKRVRITEIEGNDFITGPVIDITALNSSNSFLYEVGNNVNPQTNNIGYIPLPGTCGGRYKYDVIIEGDCMLGDGDPSPNVYVGASLTLEVYEVPSPEAPAPVTMSLCESEDAIMTAYTDWVNGFSKGFLFDEENPFCPAVRCTDDLYFGDCNLRVEYTITKGFLNPPLDPCIGDIPDEECFRYRLQRALKENDLNCGVRITARISNKMLPLCFNKSASSSFELVAPTITASAPTEHRRLQACSSIDDIRGTFKGWLDKFTFSVEDDLLTGSTSSCELNEEFYVNGSTVSLTRDQLEAEYCGGTTAIEYVVALERCRGVRSNVATATFTVEEPEITSQVTSVCSEAPVAYSIQTNTVRNQDLHQFQVVEIISNGLIPGATNVTEGQMIGVDGLINDRWTNDSDLPIQMTYVVLPFFDCSADGACQGSLTEIPVTVKSRPKSLIGYDKTIRDGDPLGLELNFQGASSTSVEVDFYDVAFTGFEPCNESFQDGNYLPNSLETILSSTSTKGCADNCADETVQIEIIPLSGGCRGEKAIFNVIIQYVDDIAPSIQCPPGISVQCLSDLTSCLSTDVVVMDNCPGTVVTCEDGSLAGGSCGGTILRTYTARDAANNVNSCAQIITIDDDIDPEITCPENITVYVDANCMVRYDTEVTGIATGTDNCTVPDITLSDELMENTPCHGSSLVKRTWTATDACENSSECVQTITLSDTTAPVLRIPGDTILYKNDLCQVDAAPSITGMATVEDNCSSSPSISFSDFTFTNNPCGGSDLIERTWTATDDCGNVRSLVQKITILDTLPPEIDCVLSVELFADENCFADTSAQNTGFLRAQDACMMGTITRSDEVTIPCEGEMQITRTWVARDACGNESTCIQYILVRDTTRPEISCPPTEELGINPVVPEAMSTDVVVDDNCSIFIDLIDNVQGMVHCDEACININVSPLLRHISRFD